MMSDTVCPSCKGKGGIDDTTYVRTGKWISCSRCFGTGWGTAKIRKTIRKAFKKEQRTPREPDDAPLS